MSEVLENVADKSGVRLDESWLEHLQDEFNEDYMKTLRQFLVEEKQKFTVYPKGSDIFNAFNFTTLDKVKLVIIGQDPYHGPGQAHGLCFSVPNGIAIPPSLRNIYKELARSIASFEIPSHGNLEKWTQQGVFLLNSSLTVRANQAASHAGKGWEVFTDKVIDVINRERESLVFLLWGSYAKNKGKIIDRTRHLVLESVHPSPLSASRGFIGSNHFVLANEYLESKGLEPIDWNL
ncbi:MAG: uracil-DNA glycosylase [Candidatus Caenarcaniphilales bacterium]|nr:uracil-DNA glycosylase [Candidatus Caenarcaniphilales bacterium]